MHWCQGWWWGMWARLKVMRACLSWEPVVWHNGRVKGVYWYVKTGQAWAIVGRETRKKVMRRRQRGGEKQQWGDLYLRYVLLLLKTIYTNPTAFWKYKTLLLSNWHVSVMTMTISTNSDNEPWEWSLPSQAVTAEGWSSSRAVWQANREYCW